METGLRSRNLSLKEKLKQHYEVKKKEGFIPTPRRLNRWAPVGYIVVIFGVAYWGIFDALPSIYGLWNPVLLKLNTCFCCLVFLEVMVNWICIHIVDSSYQPNIHGTKPNGAADSSESEIDMDKIPMNGYNDGVNFKMYVATSISDVDGTVERSTYPYWSWVPCLACQRLRPPRCHHCVLCRKCVLKRDHHCFFARACVGVNNQRHFIVFLFWAFTGTIYSILHMIPYFYYDVLPSMSYVDIIPPVAFLRALCGYQNYLISLLMGLAWGLLAFTVLTGKHFVDCIGLIIVNKTSFEQDNGIKITDCRSLGNKLGAVFGHYWFLNVLMPVHMFFKPLEDPVLWPYVKPYE